MILLAYYILKVIVCSAIFFGYYFVTLRNKQFHHWNRFYLLASVLLSLLVPCLQFTLTASGTATTDAVKLLSIVYIADGYVSLASAKELSFISMAQACIMIYCLVSFSLLVYLLHTLKRIHSLIKSSVIRLIHEIKFISTDVKGSPFSFFNYILWNKNIDLSSATGQHIFQHELVHVRELHTLDKICMQVVLIFFWCNPVFWLIRKELRMIHEFIADEKAVGNRDGSIFAAMLLQAAYPDHYNNLTNQFFQTSIKRRLAMLTKKQNQKISYAGRLLALPLIAFVVFAFTIKTNMLEKGPANIVLDKKIKVVIDAGHGGMTGARAGNIYEDDLVLELARAVREENSNKDIEVILTRGGDAAMAPGQRVQVASDQTADLFISLHMNASPSNGAGSTSPLSETNSRGIEVYIPKTQSVHDGKVLVIGSALIKNLSEAHQTFPKLLQRTTGIWVLDKNVCPAVLIECGYVTDDKDLAFISSKKNRQLIAQKILKAIEQYATAEKPEVNSIMNTRSLDTLPKVTLETNENPLIYIDGKEKGRLKESGGLDKLVEPGNIKSMMVYKGREAIENYGSKGSEGVIVIISNNDTEPARAPSPKAPKPLVIKTPYGQNPMVYIDGKESGRINDGKMKELKGEDIESVNVLKGESAVTLYGEKGKEGVIEIKMKKDKSGAMNYTPREKTSDAVFTKVEISPQFPGGQQAWTSYLQKNLNAKIPVEKGAPAGNYEVAIKFLVNKDGTLQDLEPLSKIGYGTEEEAMRILRSGPKWTPAIQNGKNVASIVEQKVTFVIAAQ